MRPADVLLHRGNSWTDTIIRWAQRVNGYPPAAAAVTHVAIVTDTTHVSSFSGLPHHPRHDYGIIGSIEATHHGTRRRPVSVPLTGGWELAPITASAADREHAVRFAESRLGQRYGWVTILSIALHFLTGGRLALGLDGTEICSALVARALEHAGYELPFDPANATPADIAMLLTPAKGSTGDLQSPTTTTAPTGGIPA